MRPYQLPPEIQKLTPDQRALLDSWIEAPDCSVRLIVEKYPVEFGLTISKGKVERYIQHRSLTQTIEEATGTEADVEDLLAIYNGQPTKIPEAALLLLYQRAFKLIADPKTKKSVLLSMFRIVTYKDRQDWLNHKKYVNEERLSIQRRRETTREQALDHKIDMDTQKLALAQERQRSAPGTTRVPRVGCGVPPHPSEPSPNPDDSYPPSDTVNPNQESEIRNQESNPPRSPELTAYAKSTPFLRLMTRNSLADLPDEAREFAEPDGSMPTHADYYGGDQNDPNRKYKKSDLQFRFKHKVQPKPEPKPDDLLCPGLPPGEATTPEPAPSSQPNQKLEIRDQKLSLVDRLADYIDARQAEAEIGRDSSRVGRFAAQNFRSDMRDCPCGKALPCPEHGDFPEHFFELDPTDYDFRTYCLKNNLPYHEAMALSIDRRDKARRAAHAAAKAEAYAAIAAEQAARAAEAEAEASQAPPIS